MSSSAIENYLNQKRCSQFYTHILVPFFGVGGPMLSSTGTDLSQLKVLQLVADNNG